MRPGWPGGILGLYYAGPFADAGLKLKYILSGRMLFIKQFFPGMLFQTASGNGVEADIYSRLVEPAEKPANKLVCEVQKTNKLQFA